MKYKQNYINHFDDPIGEDFRYKINTAMIYLVKLHILKKSLHKKLYVEQFLKLHLNPK